MFDTYVIEIDSDAAGLVVRDRGDFVSFPPMRRLPAWTAGFSRSAGSRTGRGSPSRHQRSEGTVDRAAKVTAGKMRSPIGIAPT